MKTPNTVEFKSLLIIGGMLMANLSQAQLDLTLDSDTPSVKNAASPLLDSPFYNVADDVMSVTTEFPIVCTHILGYEPISDVQLKVFDPNNIEYNLAQLRDFNLGVAQDISYDLSGNSINIVSENRNKAKCITSGLYDLISNNGFEEPNQDVVEVIEGFGIVKYEGLPDAVIGNVIPISYDVTYTNTGSALQTLDYVDYWPSADTTINHFTFNVNPIPGDPVWFDCNEDTSGVNCGSFDIERISELRSVRVNPGATIRISYNKFLLVPQAGNPGPYVDMMAGFFIKTESAEGIDGANKSGSTGFVYLKHAVVEKRIRVN